MNAPLSSRARLYAGLDGLRALAVTLVVVYHVFPAWGLGSGFLGVDVFFVISGFLITSLLLREHADAGRIRLADFWRRRARRLLPALAVVVTVCATAAYLVGADLLVGLDRQLLGAATFSSNWVSIAVGSDYFAATAPEVFGNLWSLAVEEQFYLVWPLALPLFLALPRRWARVLVASVLAAASATAAVVLMLGGADPTRVYFGTDTHAFGLLLGVTLAFAVRGVLDRPAPPATATVALGGGWTVFPGPAVPQPWPHRRSARTVTGIAGTLAVAGIVALAALPPLPGALTYPGVLVAASVLSALAICCAIWPGSWFGRRLDAAPLRWVGQRSYGIYLWHWPVLVILTHATTGRPADAATPLWVGLLTVAVTLVAADASYRWVEMPVRRHGFAGSLRALRVRLAGTPRHRFGAVAAVAVAALALSGTTATLATAPEQTTSEIAIEAGQAAMAAAEAEAEAEAEAGADAAPDVLAPVTGDQITAVGDSVMLASAPALLQRYPGIAIDAAVSRSMWAGPEILRALDAQGALRPVVVVALGTNGAASRDALREMADIVGADRKLVLVNAFAPRDWIDGVNGDLRAFARGRGNVAVADWSGAIAGRTDLLAGDGVHPAPAAAEVYAATVADTVDRLNISHAAHRERAAGHERARELGRFLPAE